MNTLPRATASTELTLLGVTLHCYVLDDGRRIINADDFHALMTEIEYGEAIATDEDMRRVAAFITGRDA